MLVNFSLQDFVGGQSNGVLGIRFFQIGIKFRFCKGGVPTEGRCDTTFGIPIEDGIKIILPVIGAVVVAGTQRTFQHPILVEREERVVTFEFEITVVFAFLLLAVDLAG